jgi:hypothetical protein
VAQGLVGPFWGRPIRSDPPLRSAALPPASSRQSESALSSRDSCAGRIARSGSACRADSSRSGTTAKGWILGTHKGVSRHHLAAYLDEFVFRHNRRTNLGAAFQTLLGLGTSREPTTYATITGAQDLPTILYTPSAKVAGTHPKRARFTPAPPTYPVTPEA